MIFAVLSLVVLVTAAYMLILGAAAGKSTPHPIRIMLDHGEPEVED